jgi:hypothetical protein
MLKIPKNNPLNMSCAWPPQSGRRNQRKLSWCWHWFPTSRRYFWRLH